MKISVSWDVTSWNLVDSCQRIGGNCYLHLRTKVCLDIH